MAAGDAIAGIPWGLRLSAGCGILKDKPPYNHLPTPLNIMAGIYISFFSAYS